MTDAWTSRLSEYVDEELDGDTARALEAHLTECEVCRRTLDDLRAVSASAGALHDREPDVDLWPGIAERIRTAPGGDAPVVDLAAHRSRRRGFTMTVPQALAAGVILVVVGASSAMLAMRPPATGAPGPVALGGSEAAFVAEEFEAGGAQYDMAVADLFEALDRHRDALDSSTVAVLEQSLAVIDTAIAEARDALRREPDDGFLNAHLAHAKRKKLELLTRAVGIATASS